MGFREHTLEQLVQIGLVLFGVNFENFEHYNFRTDYAKMLYEEIVERIVIERQALIPAMQYESLFQLRESFGMIKGGIKKSKYPFDNKLKENLFGVYKIQIINYFGDKVYERLKLPASTNTIEPIKSKGLEDKLIFIFENLHFLNQGANGLNNTTNFMSRAEIARELILIVCEHDKEKISEISERIEYDTNQYDRNFNSTLSVFEKHYNEFGKFSYLDDRKTYPTIEQCKRSLRHNFAGSISTSKDLLPQVLSRKVVDLLNDFLTPSKKTTSKHETHIKNEKSIKKVLFLTANPEETSLLRLDKEIRTVKNGFDSATERDNFEFISEPAVTISDITKAIQKEKPHIVHFSGHGAGEDGIIVEGTDGEMVCFSTESLSNLFDLVKEEIECVVLNACHSNTQAIAISKNGASTEKGIYAIGTNKAIGDQAAISFSTGFYQAIGEGKDYRYAFKMGLVHVNNPNAAKKSEIWFNGENVTETNNFDESAVLNEINETTIKENKSQSEILETNSSIEKEVDPKNMFICYAGKDSSFKERLESSFVILKRENKIKIWSDQEILAGQKPDEITEMQLKNAAIIVLLLSPDLLASNDIWEKQMPLIKSHLKNKTAKVVPILLRACDWKGTEIKNLRTIPTNPKNAQLLPIAKWEDQDEAWQVVLDAIKKIL